MTDRRHMDPNLMGPPRLELASNEACPAESFLHPPVGRGVPTTLRAHDRHFLPIARIPADRRGDLARGPLEPPPDERQIFSLERAGAAMVGEEFSQAPMRRIRLGDDQKPRCILVEAVHNSGPLAPADPR